MMRSRTSWIPKLRPDQEPKIVTDPKGRSMLVPTPLLVAAEVRRIRKGQLTTPLRIRERLAAAHQSDVTCPMTTGIFLNIIAGAAEEQLGAGQRPVAPYWRVIREDGTLNPRLPVGRARQAARLRAEGHRVTHTRAKDRWTVGP